MRILTYKRTHVGDPDEHGRVGIYGCMGRVRNYGFDAVIGIGGIEREPKSFGIDRKINWVGINPKRRPSPGGRESRSLLKISSFGRTRAIAEDSGAISGPTHV